MNNTQLSVAKFMQMAGTRIGISPQNPSFDERHLCAKLILEEAFETVEKGLGLRVELINGDLIDSSVLHVRESAGESDPVELADGMGDTKYVLDWTANVHGIDMEPVENEICRSNLTKFVWSGEEIDDAKARGCTVKIYDKLSGGRFKCCVKNEHGKVQKPPSYSKADIASIISNQNMFRHQAQRRIRGAGPASLRPDRAQPHGIPIRKRTLSRG